MQSNITRRLGALPAMNPDRWTSIVIWLIGCWTTRQALLEAGVGAGVVGGEGIALVAALGLQWILTRVERRVWLGKVGIAPVLALALDTLANAAGMFPYIRNFGNTSVWAMLQQAAETNAPFTLTAALGVSLGLGYAVARLPEQLWSE